MTGPSPTMSLDQAVAWSQSQGVDRLDSQLLLLHALRREPADRAWLLAHGTQTLAPSAAQDFARLVARRADQVPLAYLTGWREFHGLRLRVNAHVLDPRPDTETLVDWALSLDLPPTARVVDLGTGCGAIALALKAARPQWQLSAVERSAQALDVARDNGQRLGLEIDWRAGSWCEPLAALPPFDLMVSNPPYIRRDDPHLLALRHEPGEALVSGADGLDDLRRIASQAQACLRPGGWLLLEHGHEQADAVAVLLRETGWLDVDTRADLAGIVRCTGARTGAAR